MRKNLLILTGLMIGLWAHAQDPEAPTPPKGAKVHELGINFGSLNGFGMHYRVGNSRAVWGFGSASLGATLHGTKNDLTSSNDQLMNASFYVSREYRKPLLETMEFRSGFALGVSYSLQNNNGVSDKVLFQQLTPYAGAFMGLNYVIKNCLVLGASFGGDLRYTYSRLSSQTPTGQILTNTHGFSLGVRNAAGLSISFRF